MKKDVFSLTRSLARPAHQVISSISGISGQFSGSKCNNYFKVVKNGAGSLQQFEIEKDYYIQRQKEEIALLRSQVSATKLESVHHPRTVPRTVAQTVGLDGLSSNTSLADTDACEILRDA